MNVYFVSMNKTLNWFLYVLILVSLVWMEPGKAQNFFAQNDLQWVAVPDHADWIYKVGEKASVNLQLLWHGQPLPSVEVRYAIGQDELADEVQGKVTTDAQGRARIPLGGAKQPSFRDCRMQCTVEGKNFKNHVKVGFSPEKITPYTQMPNDFATFWQGVLDEQKNG